MGMFLDAAKMERIPVCLITGFLGSGKTTLLNRLVQQEEMANSAIIINEYGDVPLDQHFVEKKQDDVVVMPSGCLCCTVRGDFEGVMGSLFGRRDQREGRAFDRIVIETTGVADPTAIIELLLNSPLIIQYFLLDSVVTTVDAVYASQQLSRHSEAVTQIAVADRLLITKTDLVRQESVDELKDTLVSINASATLLIARHGDVSAKALFGAGLASTGAVGPERWLGRLEDSKTPDASPTHGDVRSFSLVSDRPLRWNIFNRWLTGIRVAYAEQLLRVKGIVQLAGESEPVAIHGVHHVFHPPVRVGSGFRDAPRTRLVFIVRGDIRQDIARRWQEMIIDTEEESLKGG